MKRLSTLFLRLAVFAAAAVVLALCGGTAWMAFAEANPASEYYYLEYVLFAGVCAAAIPYFIALYQTYRILGYIDTGRIFSESATRALRIIMRSAIAVFLVCTFGGLPFFFIAAEIDDAPGLVLIGMGIAGAAFSIAVFASVLNRLLQEAIAFKSENDLTI